MSEYREPDLRALDRSVAVDWNDRVESWEAVAASPAFQRFAAEVIGLADPVAGDRVVDLGAGTGLLSLAIAPKVEHVLAVDSSEAMLARLHANRLQLGVENVSTRVADLRRLPLPDESVSLVVSNYAFHHLDDAGKELALAEARRVLVPGGRLVVCDMMFRLSLQRRDRALVGAKIWAIARRGPGGFVRIGKNAARLLLGRWERPCGTETWEEMLLRRSFGSVDVRLLESEAGIAYANRPPRSRTSPATEHPLRVPRPATTGIRADRRVSR